MSLPASGRVAHSSSSHHSSWAPCLHPGPLIWSSQRRSGHGWSGTPPCPPHWRGEAGELRCERAEGLLASRMPGHTSASGRNEILICRQAWAAPSQAPLPGSLPEPSPAAGSEMPGYRLSRGLSTAVCPVPGKCCCPAGMEGTARWTSTHGQGRGLSALRTQVTKSCRPWCVLCDHRPTHNSHKTNK